MATGGTRAVVAALLANLAIAVAKFVGFLITRSSSMLAESVHSVADSGNQALLLLGGRMARRQSQKNIRSDTVESGTSGCSSSRSCCSRLERCSP
jgi:Co/Zn/Cd efflux system component